MATVAIDESPAGLLRSFRGEIVAALPAYPEVLHLDVRDSRGGLWRFATQDADYFPSDPSELFGLSVEDAELDERTGELRLALSNDSAFRVVPAPREAADDPANWILLTPAGLALVYGPGSSWQLKRADDPV